MVLREIAYYPIAGIPLLMIGGLIGLILLIITAIVGAMVLRGKAKMKFHKTLAILTLIIGLIHGIVAFLALFF